MDLNLKDKVAIVTGATGICKTTALRLAEEGMDIVVTYLTDVDEKATDDTVKKIISMGYRNRSNPSVCIRSNRCLRWSVSSR